MEIIIVQEKKKKSKKTKTNSKNSNKKNNNSEGQPLATTATAPTAPTQDPLSGNINNLTCVPPHGDTLLMTSQYCLPASSFATVAADVDLLPSRLPFIPTGRRLCSFPSLILFSCIAPHPSLSPFVPPALFPILPVSIRPCYIALHPSPSPSVPPTSLSIPFRPHPSLLHRFPSLPVLICPSHTAPHISPSPFVPLTSLPIPCRALPCLLSPPSPGGTKEALRAIRGRNAPLSVPRRPQGILARFHSLGIEIDPLSSVLGRRGPLSHRPGDATGTLAGVDHATARMTWWW